MMDTSHSRRSILVVKSNGGGNDYHAPLSREEESSTTRRSSRGPARPQMSVMTPVTRRKLKLEKERKARERRRAILLGVITTVVVLVFILNVVHDTRSLETHRKVKEQSAGGNEGSDAGGSGAGARAGAMVVVGGGSLRGIQKRRNAWVTPDSQPFNEHSEATQADHLIMVAGHSVVIAGNLEDAGIDENVWFLLDYQKGKGLPQAIVSHIRTGIAEAAKDPKSLLIFSGGETRAKTGPVNEGGSYFRVADAMSLWQKGQTTTETGTRRFDGSSTTVRARTTTEEYATDSFQNLLFSICRFKEVTGSYPRRITVVSFSFKRNRFVQLHAKALQWPSDQFNYVGVDPPDSTGFDLKEATAGELKDAALPFETDPYGCHTPVLQEKRMQRNPFARTPPYELTCPEMKDLLRWCSPGLFPSSKLPWGNA